MTIIPKIKNIYLGESSYDLLEKLFVLFVVVYVLFFGAETILPGIIMDIFNINILLLLITIDLILLILFYQTTKEKKVSEEPDLILNKWILWTLIIYFSFILVIALYRISLVESAIYLLLGGLAGKLIFLYIKKKP